MILKTCTKLRFTGREAGLGFRIYGFCCKVFVIFSIWLTPNQADPKPDIQNTWCLAFRVLDLGLVFAQKSRNLSWPVHLLIWV